MMPSATTAFISLFSLLPYFLTGLAPFLAGSLLAQLSGFPLRPAVLVAGGLAVAALILAAFGSREAFCPGVGRAPALKALPSPLPLAALVLAALLGLLLQFYWRTGDLTIPLGGLGVLGGYFYFAPPLAWHRRFWGEAAGAVCFSLLPVVTGFYLLCNHLVAEVLLYGLPLSFAAFNLFLINGFPDPAGPGAPKGYGLAARLGPLKGALVYTIHNILTIVALVVCLLMPASPLPFRAGVWALLALAVVNQELIKRRQYLVEPGLKLLCRLTLALHLGMGLVFCLILALRL